MLRSFSASFRLVRRFQVPDQCTLCAPSEVGLSRKQSVTEDIKLAAVARHITFARAARFCLIIIAASLPSSIADTSMARFALSNPQDQSAASWIVAFLLLSYTTLTTMVRGFVKFSMLGLDDGVAVLAQLFAYGNALSVIIALRDGLAKSSSDHGRDGNEPGYGKVSMEITASLPPGICDTDKDRPFMQASYFTLWHRLRQRSPRFSS